MHVIGAVLLTVGALAVLVLGLSSVLRDLLDRSSHEPPLLEDDGLAWPRRYQGLGGSDSRGCNTGRHWTDEPARGHPSQV